MSSMRTMLLATAIASLLAAPASAITFVNSLTVPNGTDLSGLPAGVNSNRFGGFGSDLIYDAATNSYFGLTDRGPGGGTIDYAPRLHNFSVTTDPLTGALSNFTLNKTVVFKQADGVTPFSGLNSQLLGDVTKLGKSFDPEGMVHRANGNFLISDEYGPSVYEFDPNGVFVRAFKTPANLVPLAGATPDFTNGRPTITTGRQDNRGYEGLTLSPDGTTAYAILQDPLVNEGAADGRFSRNLRIVAYDVATGNATGQYVYQLEDLADINGRIADDSKDFAANNQGRSIGASSIVALPNGQLLVIERDNRGLGVEDPNGLNPVASKRVYLIDLAGATDVSAISLAGTNALPAGVTPVSKLLFLDVQSALEAAGAVVPEKLEGLSFGPWLADGGLSLMLVTDSDFSVTQNSSGIQFDVCTSGVGGVSSQVGLDAGCPAGQSLIPSYVMGFKLSSAEASALGFSNPAGVPEPASWATMIAGFLVAGSAMRRRRRSLPRITA
jgi:hypothetical protein